MTPAEAAALARRLLAAFPFGGPDTALLFAEKMQPWDIVIAQRAVERLVDNARSLPTVYELRESYTACGGDLPDSTRNMSPPRRVVGEVEIDPEELRALVARLTRGKGSVILTGQDDDAGVNR